MVTETTPPAINPKDQLLLIGSIRTKFNENKELPYTTEVFTARIAVVAIGKNFLEPRVLMHSKYEPEIMDTDMAVYMFKKTNGLEKEKIYINGVCYVDINPGKQTIKVYHTESKYGQVCGEEIRAILQNIFQDYAITLKPGHYKDSIYNIRKAGVLYRD